MNGSGASVYRPGNAEGRGSAQHSGGKLLMWTLLGVAFLEGASVMVVELTAARLLAPYFGQSVFVWTNVIGIILAAVAVGNYFGGRLADRCKTVLPLFACLLLSGAYCIAVPFFISRVASFFIGEDMHLEEAFMLLNRGSFCTTLLLFAPPVFLAGACLPFLVKGAAEVSGRVGRASGSVYGVSTLGSILGTFLSTYLFIEVLGSKTTFYAVGLILVVTAALGFLFVRSPWVRGTGAAVLVTAISLACLGPSPGKAIKPIAGLMYACESRYQYLSAVRVEQHPETVYLRINEGLDSFQSIYTEGTFLTGGQYYDYYLLLPALAGMESPHRVCIVGLAGGTIARQYAHFFGKEKMQIDGVEIDGKTVELGRRYMDLEYASPCLETHCDRDGRMFLNAPGELYDVIVLDAYAQQIYIPFHMTTREFFKGVHDRLRVGGIMGMNVSGFSHDDHLLSAMANTAASVFGSVSVARVPDGRNFVIYAVRDRGYVDPGKVTLPNGLAELDHLLQALVSYGVTRRVTFDEYLPLLTDDWAPVENLCDRDLLKRSMALIEEVGGVGP